LVADGLLSSADLKVVAKRKTLFDDRPVEISELTYVIKQDLASLNQQIASLQALTLSQHPKTNRSKADQEGEHNDNVSGLQVADLRNANTT
jgi:syntaxin 5